MNNTQKYSDLIDYSTKLRKAIHEFDTILFSKPPKQMGSFIASLQALQNNLDNIKKSQELLDMLSGMPSIDEEAIKNNKSARKAIEQIKNIKSQIRSNVERLKEQYFKQLDVCYKQYKEVGRNIKDSEDKKRFNGDKTMNFRLMMNEYKHEIPFNITNELKDYMIEQTKYKHQKQKEQMDENLQLQQENINELEMALDSIKIILATTPNSKLAKEVRKEVAQIKKVLTPKAIAISKANLEKLRHSSQLLLDLEQISQLFNASYGFLGADGNLQKINEQLDSLPLLLEQAITEEKEKNIDIKQERDDTLSKVNYATEAVRTYGDVLGNNVKLGQEQIQIRNNTHELYDENARLKDDEKKVNAEAREIENKPLDRQELYDSVKIDQLYERARNDRQAIRDNEAYMADKMIESVVEALPLKYTEMKKRLKNMSSLYQISETEELINEGMIR